MRPGNQSTRNAARNATRTENRDYINQAARRYACREVEELTPAQAFALAGVHRVPELGELIGFAPGDGAEERRRARRALAGY
jgi:membrane peptidoglycan carboxypeptidase